MGKEFFTRPYQNGDEIEIVELLKPGVSGVG